MSTLNKTTDHYKKTSQHSWPTRLYIYIYMNVSFTWATCLCCSQVSAHSQNFWTPRIHRLCLKQIFLLNTKFTIEIHRMLVVFITLFPSPDLICFVLRHPPPLSGTKLYLCFSLPNGWVFSAYELLQDPRFICKEMSAKAYPYYTFGCLISRILNFQMFEKTKQFFLHTRPSIEIFHKHDQGE